MFAVGFGSCSSHEKSPRISEGSSDKYVCANRSQGARLMRSAPPPCAETRRREDAGSANDVGDRLQRGAFHARFPGTPASIACRVEKCKARFWPECADKQPLAAKTAALPRAPLGGFRAADGRYLKETGVNYLFAQCFIALEYVDTLFASMRESVSKVARLAGGPRSTRGAREGERQMEESKNTFSRRQFVELLGVSAAGFGLVSMAGCSGGDTSAPAASGGDTTGGGAADAITYSLTADPRARPGVLRRRRVRGRRLQHPRGPVPVRRQGCEGRPVPGSRSARDLGRRQGVHHQAARRASSSTTVPSSTRKP